MPEGSRHIEQALNVPDAQSHMRYDDLKPVVRSYVDNLTEQVADLVRTYGVSHPKELIPLMETDVMRIEDVRRFGALSEALKVCFENRLPLEAKREARGLKEKAQEQYEAVKKMFNPQVVFEMVESWAPESRRDVLSVMYEVDRPLFDDVSKRNQTPELQYAVVEALARNGELQIAMDRANALDPRTLGEVFDHSALHHEYKRLYITIATLAVEHGQFEIAKQAFLIDPKNDHVARKLIFGLIEAGKFDQVDDVLKLTDRRTQLATKRGWVDLYIDIAEILRVKKKDGNAYLTEVMDVIRASSNLTAKKWRTLTHEKLPGELIRHGRIQDAREIMELGFDMQIPKLVRLLAEQGEESEAIRLIDARATSFLMKTESYLELALCAAKKGDNPKSYLGESLQFYQQIDHIPVWFIECKLAGVYTLLGNQNEVDQSVQKIDVKNQAFTYTSLEIADWFCVCEEFALIKNKKTGDPSIPIDFLYTYVEECAKRRGGGNEVIGMFIQIADLLRKLNNPNTPPHIPCRMAIEYALKIRRSDLLLEIAQYCIDHGVMDPTNALVMATSVTGLNTDGRNKTPEAMTRDLFNVAIAKAKNRLDCQSDIDLALVRDQNAKNSVREWIHGHLALANVYLEQARGLEEVER